MASKKSFVLVCSCSNKRNLKIKRRNWKEKTYAHNISATFPASTKYNLLREQGFPWECEMLWLIRARYEEIWQIMHTNQEQKKEISSNMQPGGPSKRVSVATNERIRPGDKTTVWSKGKQIADIDVWISLTTLMTVMTMWQLTACQVRHHRLWSKMLSTITWKCLSWREIGCRIESYIPIQFIMNMSINSNSWIQTAKALY